MEAQEEPIKLTKVSMPKKRLRNKSEAVTKLSPHPGCFTVEVTKSHWPQTSSADVVGCQLQCLQEKRLLAVVTHVQEKDSKEPR